MGVRCLILIFFQFFGRPGPLLAPFGLDLGGSGARFWEVLGSSLEACGDNLGIRLLLFVLPTSTPRASRIKPPLQREHDYLKIAFRNLYRFFIDFGANKPPFLLQKSIKIASKIDLGRHQFFDRF